MCSLKAGINMARKNYLDTHRHQRSPGFSPGKLRCGITLQVHVESWYRYGKKGSPGHAQAPAVPRV